MREKSEKVNPTKSADDQQNWLNGLNGVVYKNVLEKPVLKIYRFSLKKQQSFQIPSFCKSKLGGLIP